MSDPTFNQSMDELNDRIDVVRLELLRGLIPATEAAERLINFVSLPPIDQAVFAWRFRSHLKDGSEIIDADN